MFLFYLIWRIISQQQKENRGRNTRKTAGGRRATRESVPEEEDNPCSVDGNWVPAGVCSGDIEGPGTARCSRDWIEKAGSTQEAQQEPEKQKRKTQWAFQALHQNT